MLDINKLKKLFNAKEHFINYIRNLKLVYNVFAVPNYRKSMKNADIINSISEIIFFAQFFSFVFVLKSIVIFKCIISFKL